MIDQIDQKDQREEIDKIDLIDHQIDSIDRQIDSIDRQIDKTGQKDLKEPNDNKEEISTWIKADKTDTKIDSLTMTETTEEETMISKAMTESKAEINQEVSFRTEDLTMKTGTSTKIDNLEKGTSEETKTKSPTQESEDSAKTTDLNHRMGKGDKTRFPSSIHR